MIPTLHLLAQTAPAAPQGTQGLLGSPIVMILLMILMFYFLMIRPQQKQRKEQQERINSLQQGDKVVTSAGVHGIVHHIKDKTVMIKVAEGTTIEFDKLAITSVTKKDSV